MTEEKNGLRISVITVCLNNASGIEKTMQSVLCQNYPMIEYLVIDGGSTDGTVEKIEKYGSSLYYWNSRKDQGISDAFNRGLLKARGEYIAFLNSGDSYLNPRSLELLAKGAEGYDVIYGGIRYERSCRADVYPQRIAKQSDWLRGSIPHQSSITSRKVFDRVGLFNQARKYCMDYELFYKAFLAQFRFKAIPELITSVNCDGVSTKQWKAQLDEFRMVQRDLGAPWFPAGYHYYRRLLRMGLAYSLRRYGLNG